MERLSGASRSWSFAACENISPAEIEEFLHRLPEVEMAQIVGVPDENMARNYVRVSS